MWAAREGVGFARRADLEKERPTTGLSKCLKRMQDEVVGPQRPTRIEGRLGPGRPTRSEATSTRAVPRPQRDPRERTGCPAGRPAEREEREKTTPPLAATVHQSFGAMGQYARACQGCVQGRLQAFL